MTESELVEQAFLAVRRRAFAEGVRWAARYLDNEARKEGNAVPTVGTDKTVEIELLKAAKPITVGLLRGYGNALESHSNAFAEGKRPLPGEDEMLDPDPRSCPQPF